MSLDIAVAEWKRFGHHRIYASDSTGANLGFLDVKSGEVILEDGVPEDAVSAHLRGWAEAKGLTPGAPESGQAARATSTLAKPQSPKTPVPKITPEWTDLALNRPGDLTRARADEAWEREKEINSFIAHAGRVLRANTPESSLRKGAKGEERVGPLLDSLAPHGWKTLHSIPTGPKGDIDHLSIGPGGVVVFNTKFHPRAKFKTSSAGIFVNGFRTNYINEAKDQARRAYERLSKAGAPIGFVRPWIVLVNGSLLSPEVEGAFTPKDVSVSTNWNLKINLRRMEPTMSDEQVDEVFQIARKSTTWIS